MKAKPISKRRIPRIRVNLTEIPLADCAVLPVDVAQAGEPDYSDAQFSIDVKKASKKLDAMVSQALEEHAQGKTREFPV